MRRAKLFSAVSAVCWLTIASSLACATDSFDGTIKQLLTKYCIQCHGANDEVSGEVDFTKINTADEVDAEFELWETAIELIDDQAMPPEDEPRPTPDEVQQIREWYQERFVRSVKAHPGYFRPRRLSAHEYRNTLRSLLGFDLEVAIVEAEQTVVEKSMVMKLLPTDPPGESGFTNDTSGNPLTTLIWDQYSYLIDNGLDKLFSPQYRGVLELQAGPITGTHLTADQAEQMLHEFRQRSFRRTLDASAFETFRGLSGAELESALRVELKTVLMSPTFLYRGLLLDIPTDSVQPVDEFELAERLSYFLWADMPDDELLALADEGRLSSAEVYRSQIDRMLSSPRARNLASDLGRQWFSLSEIEKVSDNPPVAEALMSQPVDYLHYLFAERRPLTELISSETTFVNPHTASFYPRDRGQMTKYRKQRGIEVEIVPNQQITLANSPERGGLLTMPGILAMNKGPVLRGTWILERVLGTELPDPPADVGQVQPNVAGENLTFRQRFEAHRSNATCAVCHDKIDPLGFALQRYDNAGRYVVENSNVGRKGKGDKAAAAKYESGAGQIDTSGQLPSGESFDDFQQLRQILVTSRREDLIRNIVQQVMAFALCRRLEVYDRPTVEAIVARLNENNGTFHDLIHEVAHSLPFRQTVVRSQN